MPPSPPANMTIEARIAPAGAGDVPLTADPGKFAVLTIMPVAVETHMAQLQQGSALGLLLQVVLPPELVQAPQGRLVNAQGVPMLPPDTLAALGTVRVRVVLPMHLLGAEGLARVNAGPQFEVCCD